MLLRLLLTAAACLLCNSALSAQTPAAPSAPRVLQKTAVNPDGSITFRYSAPGATHVSVSLDALPRPLPMTRDEQGVWSVTTAVLPAEIYAYSFHVDGVTVLDPLNGQVIPSLTSAGNNITVPAQPPAPWELTDIPHGRVDHHLYSTHVGRNLPANQEGYVVYTPPGYDPARKGGYPVLYLLHGWSDNEDGWTAVGHANLILDTLIASGRAVPMIVVMPLGYGDYDFVTHGFSIWQDPAKVDANTALFSQLLLSEIVPAAEREYNIARGRENHAIAGLSMGGLESLTVGLNHTAQFAWIAGMSSAIHGEHFDEHTTQLDPAKANLRLLWVACGTSDGLLQPNRDFVAWAKAKGLPVTAVETSGGHTWLVWRDDLLRLAPLLFR